jgi:ABC-type phosphate transport system substrate-binding protein
MKLRLRSALATAAIASVSAVALTAPAGATNIIAGSGQDYINDTFTGGGSDTTYVMENDIAQLYNQSPGCATINSAGPTLGQCVQTGNAAPAQNLRTNWDHDVAVNIYPTGSGAGIANLSGATAYDFARSSRALTAGEAGANSSWAFAKDGIVLLTPGTRAANLTTQQVKDIYNGTITNWSQIPGQAAGVIHAYGMNTASGTYATFKTWLGAEPNKVTGGVGQGEALANGTYPFENDMKPVIADATVRGWNPNDTIWWASYGEMTTFGYKKQTANFWTLDGIGAETASIASDTYPLTRFLYRITPRASVDLTGTNGRNLVLSTSGASGGKAGAVRRFTEFTCQPASFFDAAGATTALNPYNGDTYFNGVGNAIANNGFQRVPSLQRTAGACRVNA